MEYGEVKKVAGKYRKELIPMLKKIGFNASVTSRKHYWNTEITVTIKTVPKNFPVWLSKYSRWSLTPNAERLKRSINKRLSSLLEDESNVDSCVVFDRNLPFKEYDGYNGS